MITYDEIKDIEAAYGSPFYLIDKQAFVDNFDNIVGA